MSTDPQLIESPFMWSKRLYAYIRYTGNTITNVHMALVDQITETEDAPKKIIDSINQHNQGAVAQPHRYTFTIRVRENSRAMVALMWILLNNRYFDVFIKPDPAQHEDGVDHPEGDPWAPGQSIFEGCLVTRRTNTIIVDDVPVSTFSCIALRRKITNIGALDFGDGLWREDGGENTAKFGDGTQEDILP